MAQTSFILKTIRRKQVINDGQLGRFGHFDFTSYDPIDDRPSLACLREPSIHLKSALRPAIKS
jgi:hypothetical protein